ncbi:MAG TPA: sarcosine oxidase subunit beta, partial [Acetobacteraceae bacterium]|nr:sarcosine oxidase subunit beta [Acetobacteraceae bacterium]
MTLGKRLRFNIYNLLRHAVGNTPWQEQWRSPEPKAAYDVVIIGAGGHGLATAYYLAREHG